MFRLIIFFFTCQNDIILLSPSVSPAEVEEEEQAVAEVPPLFTSQKSTTSVTSSEPTGTDSHCEEGCTSTLNVTVLLYSCIHTLALFCLFSLFTL